MNKEEEFHYLEDGYYVEKLEQEIERLNNIIDKAIKHINEHTENIDRGRYYEDYVETYDLLNILNGEYEER